MFTYEVSQQVVNGAQKKVYTLQHPPKPLPTKGNPPAGLFMGIPEFNKPKRIVIENKEEKKTRTPLELIPGPFYVSGEDYKSMVDRYLREYNTWASIGKPTSKKPVPPTMTTTGFHVMKNPNTIMYSFTTRSAAIRKANSLNSKVKAAA